MPITRLSYLYHQGYYEEELRKFQPSSQVLENAEDALRILRERQKEVVFGELTETQIEQSFNENIFCRAFGYSSQFMQSEGKFEVVPKLYLKEHLNDLTLGSFNAERKASYVPRVSVELKGPRKNLESGSISPVDQAFLFAKQSQTIDWVLVSNFVEIFLFDKERPSECISFDLTKNYDIPGLKRLLFALSEGAFFTKNGKIGRLEKVKLRYKGI